MTPLRGSAESTCCSPWMVDPQLAASGSSIGASRSKTTRHLQSGIKTLHPAPAGLRPLATERSAPNQPAHIGHQRSRRWPRRAIRASKHTPYMTLLSCVSHRRHRQRGRPQLSSPSPPGRRHENRIGNEKIFFDTVSRKGGEMIKAGSWPGLNPSLKATGTASKVGVGVLEKNKPHPGPAKGWTAAKPARSVPEQVER